ncbi:unnamed protein product [Ilex paraguariensis]|uniref:Uncharacterized protein n=1 Tax=Ilex paraguariensis TaxID=185542 RepID=A0ABC8UZP1_9AQUA
MAKDGLSDSETQENDSDSSSEDLETPGNGATQKVSDYEKQRMQRIEENRARMKALGLHKMANSLMGSVQKTKKKSEKGKRKVGEEDDEEYRPEREEGLSLSSEEDDNNGDDEPSGSRMKKGKKKNPTPKKSSVVQKPLSNSDFVDIDDDALMQAIALSLQDSTGVLDMVNNVPSQSSAAHIVEGMTNEGKGTSYSQEDTGKRKRKKSVCFGLDWWFY